MKIRKAELTDLSRIQFLSDELFKYEKNLTSNFNQAWSYSQFGEEFFHKSLTDQNYISLVLEERRKVAGYMITQIYENQARDPIKMALICNLFILNEFRKKGNGEELVNETLKILKLRNINRIRVETVINNVNAINFYKKMGLQEFEMILEGSI